MVSMKMTILQSTKGRHLSRKKLLCLIILSVLLFSYKIATKLRDRFEPLLSESTISDTLPEDYTRSEEKSFPLAFSILAHTDIARLKRLLLAIYRSHNFYCIHIDRKTHSTYLNKMAILSKTLGPNVYLVPRDERISVEWGKLSVLEAELVCARKAVESGYDWKYYINLAGQEFPLRTNWEMVRALRIMNGTNLVDGCPTWQRPWTIPRKESYGNLQINWCEGSFHVALTKPFVEYMFHDPKAQLLLEAIKIREHEITNNSFNDERYFATLNNNPSIIPIPGAYLGGPEKCTKIHIPTRYKIWSLDEQKCLSKRLQRAICMLGQKDLPLLKQSPALFANKFISDFDPKGYDQLEQWIKMKRQYEVDNKQFHPSFNQTFYEMLEIRWNHL